MAKVIGIGGVFVASDAPDALRTWYADVLGLSLESWGGAILPHTVPGYALWTASSGDTASFAPSTVPVMVNLVVDDLDALLARVEDAGVDVLGRDEQAGQGRFAWIIDPVGMKLELWQPEAE